MEKSNLDVAFELVSKKRSPVEFKKLWEEVSQIQGLSEEEAAARAGKFYTQLSLDGRFIVLCGNTWDLRSRYTFDKVHIEMNEVYEDDASDDDGYVEDASEKDPYDEESEDEDENDDEGSEEEFESSNY